MRNGCFLETERRGIIDGISVVREREELSDSKLFGLKCRRMELTFTELRKTDGEQETVE